MKKQLFLLIIIGGLFSCGSKESNNNKVLSDKAFDSYKEAFVIQLWKYYPEWATSQGFHNYDSVLIIPDEAGRNNELAFLKSVNDSLNKFIPDSLSSVNRTDYYLIKNFADGAIFSMNEVKSFEWNPSQYNFGGSIADILNSKQINLNAKIENAISKLKSADKYFAAAKANLKNVTKEHTELAVSQIKGSVDYLKVALSDSISKSSLDENTKKNYQDILSNGMKAFEAFNEHLNGILKQTDYAYGSFRLGKEKYQKAFEFGIQSGFTADEIYNKAPNRKKEVTSEMA